MSYSKSRYTCISIIIRILEERTQEFVRTGEHEGSDEAGADLGSACSGASPEPPREGTAVSGHVLPLELRENGGRLNWSKRDGRRLSRVPALMLGREGPLDVPLDHQAGGTRHDPRSSPLRDPERVAHEDHL